MAAINVLKNLICIFLIFKTVSCANLNGISSEKNDQDLYPLMEKYLNEAVGNVGEKMKGEIPETAYAISSNRNDKDLYPVMEKYLNEAVGNVEYQMKGEIPEKEYGISLNGNDQDLYPLMEKYLNEAASNGGNRMKREIPETVYGISSNGNDQDLYPLMEKYLNEAVGNVGEQMKGEIPETAYGIKSDVEDKELYPLMEKYLNEAVGNFGEQTKHEIPEAAYGPKSDLNDKDLYPIMEKYLNEAAGYLEGQKNQKIIDTAPVRIYNLNDVESDPELEKYLREALENFKEQMKEGISAINLPVLDPLHLQDLDINVNENVATMNLNIKQITIRELSTFQLQQLNANLETYYLKLKLALPAVRAVGKYNLNGKLMRIFPLTGNGAFSINITNAEISGLGKLEFKDDTLQLNKIDLDLSWGGLQIYLENFLGGGGLSKHVQKLLPNVGKNMFENYKSGILSNLNTALKNFINNELKKPEIKDLIDGLIPRAERS